MSSSQSAQASSTSALVLDKDAIYAQNQKRIAQLEALIANPTSGQLVISKARFELALLKEKSNDASRKSQLGVQRDLAEVKGASVASTLKNKLEYAVLKAKEDKVRYELDVHHQLLKLRNKSLEEQNIAAERTYKARQDAYDAERAEEGAQQALEAAQRALSDAKAINLQRSQTLEQTVHVQEHQNKEVNGLNTQIAKNEGLIKQRLIAAGLSKKELDLIYENHEIGNSSPSSVGGKLLSKAHQLNKLVANKKDKKSTGGEDKENDSSRGGHIVPPSPSSKKSDTLNSSITPSFLNGLNDLFKKHNEHRSTQENILHGLQSEVERLNTKCSKAQWSELLKLRSSNANMKDDLHSTKQILQLEHAKNATLEAENEDQKSKLHNLGKDCIAKQTKILLLEQNNFNQRAEIFSLEKDTTQQREKIDLLEARVHALDNESESKSTKILVLEQSNLAQREQILSLENEVLHEKNTISFLNLQNRAIEERITSLDSSLGEIKVNIVHWHRLTSVMRHELSIVQEKRELEEANLKRLQRRLKFEEKTFDTVKKDVGSLDKMKVLLDYRMMLAKEEEQKDELQEMMVDTIALLEDKHRALKALQSMKTSYGTAISDKREILFLHNLLVHVHETLMEWQQGMVGGIWAPSEILLACVKHESKADAVRKMQHMRLQTLLDTKDLRRGGSTIFSDDDSKIGISIHTHTGLPNPEDVNILERKLAKITKEREEYRRKAKLEMYQISCRECNSDLRFVGKTRKEIHRKIHEHFEEIWAIKQEGYDYHDNQAEAGARPKDGCSFAKTSLAFHFADHCKECETKEDALQVCYQTIRVERRQVIRPKKSPRSAVVRIFGWGCEI